MGDGYLTLIPATSTCYSFGEENMTTAGGASQRNPLISIWVRPRATIARIGNSTKTRYVLLLASLSGIEYFVFQIVKTGQSGWLLDPRVIFTLLAIGAIVGIITIYFFSFFLRWGGKPLGGRASPVELRALLAWGAVPNIFGIVLCVIVIFSSLGRSGLSTNAAVALKLIMGGLDVWSSVITLLMLAKVSDSGFWCTVGNLLLGGLLSGVFLLVPLGFRSCCF